jgi:hypothetical protein
VLEQGFIHSDPLILVIVIFITSPMEKLMFFFNYLSFLFHLFSVFNNCLSFQSGYFVATLMIRKGHEVSGFDVASLKNLEAEP